MRNIALKLRYDGSRYHGWQVQKNEISVCQTVEQAVEATCGKAHVIGCGRTDAGVHANRYCANFRTESTIPIERIPLAINSRLPMDIAVSIGSTIPIYGIRFWKTGSVSILRDWIWIV